VFGLRYGAGAKAAGGCIDVVASCIGEELREWHDVMGGAFLFSAEVVPKGTERFPKDWGIGDCDFRLRFGRGCGVLDAREGDLGPCAMS
jgi:hypothetical protein